MMSVSDIAVLEAELCNIKDEIKELRKTILGNGQPGLTTKQAQLEQRLSDHIATSDKAETKRMWYIGTLIALGTLLINIFFHFI